MCNRDDYYARVEKMIAEEKKDICEDCAVCNKEPIDWATDSRVKDSVIDFNELTKTELAYYLGQWSKQLDLITEEIERRNND